MSQNPPSGWYPDPAGRFTQRFWDGTQWTQHVVTGNARFTDPLNSPAPAVQKSSEPSLGTQTTIDRRTHSSVAAASQQAPRRDIVSPRRNDPAPKASGWYPDPDNAGGTRYSDGSNWTGDVRPPRKSFAAPFSMGPISYLLPVILLLFVFISKMAGDETGNYSSMFWSILILVVTVAFSVWLGRGQGPSTAEVENRIAAEKKEAKAKRRSANIAGFFSGFGRRPDAVPKTNDTLVAEAAQIAAISHPDTARALQNLQNLLYTQALTDEEFQAAKDKLLGPSMVANQTEQIEQLAELHRQGVLGDLEFAAAKARVLGI